MVIRAFLGFLLLVLASGLSAGENRLAVIIHSGSGAETEESAIDRSALLALQNYLDYFLYQQGYDPLIVTSSDQYSEDDLTRLMTDSACSRLYYLRPTAEFTRHPIQIRDHHRIERHTIIDGFFRAGLGVTEYHLADGHLTESARQQIEETARPDWMLSGGSTIRIDRNLRLPYAPEPNEFVLERLISRSFDELEPNDHVPSIATPETERTIPVFIDFDSSYYYLTTSEYTSEAARMVRSASRITTRELGISLALIGTRVSSAFQPVLSAGGDTVTVHVYTQPGSHDYAMGPSGGVIGLSALASRDLTVRQLDPPVKTSEAWRSLFTVVAMVHELGHSLGAIHVSDPYSIMSHEATWLGTSRFDSFNRAVIQKVLPLWPETIDRSGYSEILAERLDETSYDLIDYPPAFEVALDSLTQVDELARKGVRPAYLRYLTSAEAYRQLRAVRAGKLRIAAEGFRRAIKQEGDHPVLYFYLSLCTKGVESEQALHKAAALGYWMARRRAAQLSR